MTSNLTPGQLKVIRHVQAGGVSHEESVVRIVEGR